MEPRPYWLPEKMVTVSELVNSYRGNTSAAARAVGVAPSTLTRWIERNEDAAWIRLVVPEEVAEKIEHDPVGAVEILGAWRRGL